MQDFHLAIISHNRPHNVEFMQTLCAPLQCHWYVNDGELDAYDKAGAHNVRECGTNICQARNLAIKDAAEANIPCIQISDDLRSVKTICLDDAGKRMTVFTTVENICQYLIFHMQAHQCLYGGVAVSSNPLNYNGDDISTDKLIVNDFICVMPGGGAFDENLALKEDYDMSIRHLFGNGVLRLNNVLCDFPHRQNMGGANDYRNDITEAAATEKLLAKWPQFVKMNPRRPGQVLLNYKAIRAHKADETKTKLFDI